MTLHISKILKFYEKCLTAAQIKTNYFIMLTTYIETPLIYAKNHDYVDRNLSIATNMKQIIKNVLLKFQQKLQQLQHQINENNIDFIQSMVSKIKNSSNIQDQEDRIIQQFCNFINSQKQKSKDPIIYYDLRYRQRTRQLIQNKIKEINNYRENYKQASQPLYVHKLERQTKSSIGIINQNQNNYSNLFQNSFKQMVDNMKVFISNIQKNLNQLNFKTEITEQKNHFLDLNINIINKRGKVSQKQNLTYFKSLNTILNIFLEYYKEQKQSFRELRQYLTLILKNINIKIYSFEKNDQINSEKLGMISKQVLVLMNINTILKVRSSIMKYFNLKNVITDLIYCLGNLEKSIIKNQQAINKEKNTLSQSGINMNMKAQQLIQKFRYSKQFLQTIQKNQRNILSQCFQHLNKLLFETKSVFANQIKKDTVKFYDSKLEERHISKIMNSLYTDGQQSKNEMSSRSFSTDTRLDSSSKNEISVIKEGIQFSEELKVYDKSNITGKEGFTCALGPRLLLHGKMYPEYEGIYFESRFNKKNFLFGKTKIFIPRKQICGFSIQNVFGFIPDIFEVQTNKGSLIFHSLGGRQKAINILNQQYFPQAIQQQQNQLIDQFHQGQYTKPINFNALLEPLNNHILSTIYQDCTLPKYFRRYLSEDNFQFQGKTYENFKIYFTKQIGCIDPKTTPITPQAPFYFQYKSVPLSVNVPQKSEKLTRYKKNMPKIPFLSSGGESFCQEKEVFYWISPQFLVIESTAQVMGFSLTEGMSLISKFVFQQQANNLSLTITSRIDFVQNSAVNGIISNSALSNLKQVCLKHDEFVKKYQKIRKRKTNKKLQSTILSEIDQIKIKNQSLQTQNIKLRKRVLYLSILLAILIMNILIHLTPSTNQ